MPEEHGSADRDSGLERDDVSSNALERLAAEAKSMLPPINHNPAGPNIQDITSHFTQHTASLPSGRLVQDEFFTLFEAVGALEIMDPKMDSGFIPPGDDFDPEFDVEGDLSAAELLWVMDRLMGLEGEWLAGFPLSQTVFTCLFVGRLLEPGNRGAAFRGAPNKGGGEEIFEEALTHTVLRTYCVAVVKCVELSMQAIQGQTYYEEEDFVTHLFGRELLPKTTIDDTLQMVEDAKVCLEEARSLSSELSGALEARLVFREHMLDGLRGLSLSWEHMLDGLDDIATTHSLSTPRSDAFSSKIQRQLATSTPPRPMLDVSWDQAMTNWRQLISDVLEAYRLTTPDVICDPQNLQRATWTFAYRNPPSTTLPRAILQEQLFHEQGPVGTGIGHYELFLVDLRNIVLAGDSLVDPASFQVELPSDPRHMRARLLEGFLEKAFDEYLNLYRMVCQNRCRIRRLFTQAISILDALESEAARVDQAMIDVPVVARAKDLLQKDLKPLSSWAKFYKLRVMAWTVQMGIETEIYMNDELGSMYFYLSQLATSQSQLIEHIEHHLQARIKRKPTAHADCLASQTYLHSTKLLAEITLAMSSALATFCFHLQSLGIITSPRRDFSKHHLFFDARMKPYLSVSNDRVPSAMDFETMRMLQSGNPTSVVHLEIDAPIKHAKRLLADLKKVTPREGKFVGCEEQAKREIKALETTCVAVAVNASQLARLVEKFGEDGVAGKVECSMERRWSEWWVVPVLKERK